MSDEGVCSKGSDPPSVINDKQELLSQNVSMFARRMVFNKLWKASISEDTRMQAWLLVIIRYLALYVSMHQTHGQYLMLHKRKIYGDYKLTYEDALKSERLATLLNL